MVGCTSIRPQFDAASEAALATPPPPGPRWTPDVVVQLSPALLDGLLSVLLAPPLHASLADDALSITQNVRSLKVHGPDSGCTACVGLDLSLSGQVEWMAGTLLAGSAPLEVTLAADAVVEARVSSSGAAGQTWTATLSLDRVRDVTVSLGGRKLLRGLGGVDIDRSVRSWLREELPRAVPPIPLTQFDSDLPLAAMRAVSDGDGLRIEARSATPAAGHVTLDGPPPAEGFRLGVATDTALALARAAAFRGGAVGHGVVPEPTSLSVDGGGFTMGLRLWRPVGRGWWRDYTVDGDVAVAGGKVRLKPQGVDEGGKSPGATVADPLAALFEGKILDAIGGAADAPLPAKVGTAVGKAKLDLVLTSVTGSDGTIIAVGTSKVTRR